MFTHRELGGGGGVLFFTAISLRQHVVKSDLQTTGFLLNGSDACGGIHPR